MPPAPRELFKLSVRVEGDQYYALEVAIGSPDVPFATMTEVVRQCLSVGLLDLANATTDPSFAAAVAVVKATRDLKTAQVYASSQQLVDSLTTAIRDSERSGDQRWINDARTAAQTFITNTPYQTLADQVQHYL